MTVGKDNKDKVEDVEMKDAEEEKVGLSYLTITLFALWTQEELLICKRAPDVPNLFNGYWSTKIA